MTDVDPSDTAAPDEHADAGSGETRSTYGIVVDYECVGEADGERMHCAFMDLLGNPAQTGVQFARDIDLPAHALMPGARITIFNPICPACSRPQASSAGRQFCPCGEHDWLLAANQRTATIRAAALDLGIDLPPLASIADTAAVAGVAGIAVAGAAPADDDIPDAAA